MRRQFMMATHRRQACSVSNMRWLHCCISVDRRAYLDFSDQNEMMRQILEDDPEPFSRRGMAPGSKSASPRACRSGRPLHSVDEFAQALRRANIPDGGWLIGTNAVDPPLWIGC